MGKAGDGGVQLCHKFTDASGCKFGDACMCRHDRAKARRENRCLACGQQGHFRPDCGHGRGNSKLASEWLRNAHAFRVALEHVFGRRGAAPANSMLLLPPAMGMGGTTARWCTNSRCPHLAQPLITRVITDSEVLCPQLPATSTRRRMGAALASVRPRLLADREARDFMAGCVNARLRARMIMKVWMQTRMQGQTNGCKACALATSQPSNPPEAINVWR